MLTHAYIYQLKVTVCLSWIDSCLVLDQEITGIKTKQILKE
jgi:hypothetical protein